MKKLITVLAFAFIATSAFAQYGLNNVIVHRSLNEEEASFQVVLAGPGGNDVVAMELTFSGGTYCRECTPITYKMGSPTGNSWTGAGYAPYAAGLLDKGILTIKHSNGDISRWALAFNLGTGTRTSSGQANSKAELL